MIRIFGRLENGNRCVAEMKCAVDGCERDPTTTWRVTDTRMDDDGLYVICSEHDSLTFIYPAEPRENR